MSLKKLGAITIGQSPRADVVQDIFPILGADLELVQRGALDYLTTEQMQALQPVEGDYVLVSRLLDGSYVRIAERHILPLLQEAIAELNAIGAEAILMLCTGEFPADFISRAPLIFPDKLLTGVVPALTGGHIAVIVPQPEQVRQSEKRWEGLVQRVDIVTANPYEGIRAVEQAALQLKDSNADIVVLDCIGYSVMMKRCAAEITGKQVVLPRTLLAHIVRDLLL